MERRARLMSSPTAGVPLGTAVAVVAWRDGWCNEDIARAWRGMGMHAARITPLQAAVALAPGDVVVNRIDVTSQMDGAEPGLELVERLARAGVRVLNAPRALLACHDKLEAARRLTAAGVPQPATAAVRGGRLVPELHPPVVLKPRFGSWGRDVVLCATSRDLRRALRALERRAWFDRGGAIAQAFVPHSSDLRLVMAAGVPVGAIERRPAPGDWRTNFSLGGSRKPVQPSEAAITIARAAAAAVDGDLIGVDLIATPDGHQVLELNGAVDFDRLYSLAGRDAYADAAEALALPFVWRLPATAPVG